MFANLCAHWLFACQVNNSQIFLFRLFLKVETQGWVFEVFELSILCLEIQIFCLLRLLLAVWGQDLEQGLRYNVGGWFWRLFSPFLYRHTGEDKQEEHGSGLFLSVLWSNLSYRYSYLSYMHRIQCLYSFNWGNFSLKPSKLDTNLRHKPSLKNKDFPLDSIWTSSEMVCQ